MLVDKTFITHSVVITEVRMAALKSSKEEIESKSGDKTEREKGGKTMDVLVSGRDVRKEG